MAVKPSFCGDVRKNRLILNFGRREARSRENFAPGPRLSKSFLNLSCFVAFAVSGGPPDSGRGVAKLGYQLFSVSRKAFGEEKCGRGNVGA